MALLVSPEHLDVGSATTRRAQGYLRWYPRAWRERYGEEFVAHLEIELLERPVSLARTADIVAHGFLARLSSQRGLRVAAWATTAVVLVAAVALGAIALTRYWAPVTLSSGYDGGVSGVGLLARPSQVNDMAINFSTRTRVAVRITSVAVLPLRGFLAPEVVGVEFAPHASELANARGWPVRLPQGSTVLAQGGAPLVQAIGATVTLARTNVLWLGLRAPMPHHVYAVEGLRVTYERRGVSHTMSIDQSTAPDVICSSTSGSGQFPTWCSQEIRAASAITAFSTNEHTTAQAPATVAKFVAQLALSEVQATGHGVPTLSDVRQWATQFFPTPGSDAIQSVTGVAHAGVPEWRFVIRGSSSLSTSVRCTNRGRVTAGGGIIGIGVVSCPRPSRG
ncbi:MAG: hypothetical protein ACP5OV_05980 [Acidimicrobiales bacterium]